jgi:alpha-ketoglutarate-dependent taurine dioxygenase
MGAPNRWFDATLRLSDVLVHVPSIRKMSSLDWGTLVHCFNRYGFVVLSCKDQTDSRTDLLALCPFFGSPAPHPRADEDGIVGIHAKNPIPGFIDSSHEEHRLHTDGSFLDRPERIITLQCVAQSSAGGDTVLASARAAYEFVASLYPTAVGLFSRPDALTITRAGRSSCGPLFRQDGERYHVRLRLPDGAAEVCPHPDSRRLFDVLCSFLAAPPSRFVFKLEPGQVLIADNTAILHGRYAFAAGSPRHMRRLNFDATGPLCSQLQLGFVPDSAPMPLGFVAERAAMQLGLAPEGAMR